VTARGRVVTGMIPGLLAIAVSDAVNTEMLIVSQVILGRYTFALNTCR
jgi:hypothetical protein